MTRSKMALALVLGLWLLPCASQPRPAEAAIPTETVPAAVPAPAAAPPTPARVYTNDDLERVRPFRDELGASSVPAVPPDENTPAARGGSRRGGARSRSASLPASERDEAYWRREAEKVRERVRRLEDERDMLRARLAGRRDDARSAQRRRRSTQAPGSETDRTLEARIAVIERRMRVLEDDLAERARRAGALPGWLR